MGAVTAWALGWKGAGTTVAVVDTGVQTNHPFLMNGATPKTIAEACFATASGSFTSPCPGGVPMLTSASPLLGSAAPCPVLGCNHGTHVAGIAVGGDGVVIPSGVAPAASLVAIQVFSYDVSQPLNPQVGADTADVISAMQWLHLHRSQFPGLSAVNLSLGGLSKFTGYCDANPMRPIIQQLLIDGIATVVAAGNDGWSNGVASPGCIREAVTVGAVDGVPDAPTWYSNDGPQVDLMAPGTNIYSSVSGGGMAYMSGTSMATPAVTGAFASLRQSTPAVTLERLRNSGYVVDASGYLIPSLRLWANQLHWSSPFGSLDVVRAGPGRIDVAGWAIDPDTVASIPVHVYVDGVGYALSANQSRSDVGAVYPGYGPLHGFSASLPASAGSHQVCVYGINIAGGGSNSLLGCRTVSVS